MTDKIKQIFEHFMALRFAHIKVADPYYKEWQDRFETGIEWQKSDYSNRFALKTLAPDLYPDDKDDFFIRE